MTLTVEDNNGNTSEVTATVLVEDNEAPVLTAAEDQIVILDEFCSITVPNVMGTASDNCSVTITQSPAVGTVLSSSQNATIEVLVTATDASGNTDIKTVSLTPKDQTAPVPVMENLEVITAECMVEEGDVIVPMAVDNCDSRVRVTHNVDFPITAQGSTMITWSYTDDYGNTSTQ
ncbi:hypothetical protein, partial [Longispora fulva]|uniref:hypothetical protein n=1 Tax=Longispora fulva TaxID=619741 RepID=UPI0036DAEACE